jgi:ribonuclease P protein subunit POP4
MMISPKNLVRHELIGLQVRVADSTDKKAAGLSGEVIDETRNTITVETERGVKNLVKEQCVFSFRVPSGEWVRVDGKVLVGRPEDRIKKRFEKW